MCDFRSTREILQSNIQYNIDTFKNFEEFWNSISNKSKEMYINYKVEEIEFMKDAVLKGFYTTY
ncbi:MAG TPA: hypothetical protein DDY71_05595 [Spirochaetia bacterium]|nr:hypothetical protein [Spirochaetia bacterium]